MTSIGLLVAYGLAGHVSVDAPVALIISGKIGLDLQLCRWSLLLYRRWAAEHAEIARRNGERITAEPEALLAAMTAQQSTFTRQDT